MKRFAMTSKTIKTMFFAGLIAAMILPFSGMDFAVADHPGNDKVKERSWANTDKQKENMQISKLMLVKIFHHITIGQ